MRFLFKILTSVLFVAVLVQIGLSGYGAFDAIHKAKSGPVTKHTIEHGFDPHGIVGTVILAVMVLLVLVAAIPKLRAEWLKWSVGLLVLGVIQMILAAVATSVPVVGFVHGLNAAVIYAGAAMLAHRAWTRRRQEPAPEPEPEPVPAPE